MTVLQDVLYGSEKQASLYLANLVQGTYLFQLRVTDGQGQLATATATVEVRPGVLFLASSLAFASLSPSSLSLSHRSHLFLLQSRMVVSRWIWSC